MYGPHVIYTVTYIQVTRISILSQEATDADARGCVVEGSGIHVCLLHLYLQYVCVYIPLPGITSRCAQEE